MAGQQTVRKEGARARAAGSRGSSPPRAQRAANQPRQLGRSKVVVRRANCPACVRCPSGSRAGPKERPGGEGAPSALWGRAGSEGGAALWAASGLESTLQQRRRQASAQAAQLIRGRAERAPQAASALQIGGARMQRRSWDAGGAQTARHNAGWKGGGRMMNAPRHRAARHRRRSPPRHQRLDAACCQRGAGAERGTKRARPPSSPLSKRPLPCPQQVRIALPERLGAGAGRGQRPHAALCLLLRAARSTARCRHRSADRRPASTARPAWPDLLLAPILLAPPCAQAGPAGMAPKESKKSAKPPHLELPEAPVFHPTAEEWADPLAYIADVVR